MPGDMEARTRAVRLRNGVPLQAETWAALVATGRKFGLLPPQDAPS